MILTNKPMVGVERNSTALEALRAARQFIANGIELGFISMPEPETPDSAHGTLPMIERAIADLEAKSSTCAKSQVEPILVEAVAVTRESEEDGLRLEWLLEGGIAALELPGTVLLVAQGTLTHDTGSGYVYPARNPEDDE